MKKLIFLLFSILWLFGCSAMPQLFPKDSSVPTQDNDLEQLLETAEGARAWDGATNFPGALDDDATLYDVEDDSTVEDEHHDALAQAMIAVQTKLGTGADTAEAKQTLALRRNAEILGMVDITRFLKTGSYCRW